jgi:hypothetical protein
MLHLLTRLPGRNGTMTYNSRWNLKIQLTAIYDF